MKNLIVLSFVILTAFSQLNAQKNDEGGKKNPPKLTADEVVSKHLASIGTPEDLAAVKSRVLVGIGTFSSKISPGKIGGPTQFASEGQKILLAMVLNANNYPNEKLAYDGKDLTTALLPSGGQSPLDGFLKDYKFIVKQGLFAGVLSQGWPLLNPGKGVRMEYGGVSKIDNRNLYKLKFMASGIGDMSISLYFDSETFRHVRTEYFYRTGQVTSPNPNRPETNTASASPSTYMLTEEFSDFTKVENLTLPLTYSIEYESNAGKAVTWSINFKEVYNNQALDAAVFKVS